MPFCIHRWSTIKRWSFNGDYFLIQRCRRCDSWIRRKIELSANSLRAQPIITTTRFVEKIDKVVEEAKERGVPESKREKPNSTESNGFGSDNGKKNENDANNQPIVPDSAE